MGGFGLKFEVFSENMLEVNSDYSREILKILNQINLTNGKTTSGFLANKIQIFLRNILNKIGMIVVGRASVGKSSLIKLAGDIYSELKSKS